VIVDFMGEVMTPSRWMLICGALMIGGIVAPLPAEAGVIYSNGFETNIVDWQNPTRVASGTGGITSQSGSFHATTSAGSGDFSRWGGYNYGAGNAVATVFQEYWTSIGIYLDVDAGWANDTRFDFDSAINNSSGTFLRDFIFNGGFYNDNTGPGSGTNRFVFSASNNSQPGSAFAKNPGRDPIAISATGWYTFVDHFYDNGGVLADDLTIYDAANNIVGFWTLSDASDLIGGVGGNRYAWFDYSQFSSLAFDNVELRTADASVPEPSTLGLLGVFLVSILILAGRWRRSFQS
jgi:hypothetical protein